MEDEAPKMPDWIKIDEKAGTVTIHHVVYSIAMFEELSYGVSGLKFRLGKREDKALVVERIED